MIRLSLYSLFPMSTLYINSHEKLLYRIYEQQIDQFKKLKSMEGVDTRDTFFFLNLLNNSHTLYMSMKFEPMASKLLVNLLNQPDNGSPTLLEIHLQTLCILISNDTIELLNLRVFSCFLNLRVFFCSLTWIYTFM